MLRILLISFVVSLVSAKNMDNDVWKDVVANVKDWVQKANNAGQVVSRDMVNDLMGTFQNAVGSVGQAVVTNTNGYVPQEMVNVVVSNVNTISAFWQNIYNNLLGALNQGVASVSGTDGSPAPVKPFLKDYLTIVHKMSEVYLKAMLEAQREFNDKKKE